MTTSTSLSSLMDGGRGMDRRESMILASLLLKEFEQLADVTGDVLVRSVSRMLGGEEWRWKMYFVSVPLSNSSDGPVGERA